jgi:hypothetical protein
MPIIPRGGRKFLAWTLVMLKTGEMPLEVKARMTINVVNG